MFTFTGWMLLYCIIGRLAVPLVRVLGPVSIIDYRLEETYDMQCGPLNVVYRILSPMLCCSLPMLLCVIAFDLFCLQIPNDRWLPTFWYWVFFAEVKIQSGKSIKALLPTLLEAIASVLLAVACDAFVISGYDQIGFAVFDQSNLAFQMEMVLFYVVVQVIVSLNIRRNYRLYCSSSTEGSAEKQLRYSGLVDVSEKKLFSYEREYGSILNGRYDNDLLLRIVFFAIMAIEDSNRPEGIRDLERLVFPIGISKTTGIMQQQSDVPLSDKQSVELAKGYVEEMWDDFLAKYAKSSHSENGKGLLFSTSWYEYDYDSVAKVLLKSFSSLYGDYCGTRMHKAEWVFEEVKRFEERNSYCLMPSKVVAQGSLFPVESSWVSSELAYWEDGQTVCGVASTPRNLNCRYVLTAAGDCATADFVEKASSWLMNNGYWVTCVMLVPGAIGKIRCLGELRGKSPEIKGWCISSIEELC